VLSTPVIVIGAIAFLSLVGYCSWWCYREWPRIWGTPRTAYETIVYRSGVCTFGVVMWLATSVASPGYDMVQAHASWQRWLTNVVLRAVISLPFYLWLGYWWGRVLAALFGAKDSARAA
jgi:hypothetical protein